MVIAEAHRTQPPEAPLNLNALIRGQSNALMLMEVGGWVG